MVASSDNSIEDILSRKWSETRPIREGNVEGMLGERSDIGVILRTSRVPVTGFTSRDPKYDNNLGNLSIVVCSPDLPYTFEVFSELYVAHYNGVPLVLDVKGSRNLGLVLNTAPRLKFREHAKNEKRQRKDFLLDVLGVEDAERIVVEKQTEFVALYVVLKDTIRIPQSSGLDYCCSDIGVTLLSFDPSGREETPVVYRVIDSVRGTRSALFSYAKTVDSALRVS